VKNAPSCNDEGSVKKFLDTDREADDFQNLIISSLSKNTSLVKFSQTSDQQSLSEVAHRQQID